MKKKLPHIFSVLFTLVLYSSWVNAQVTTNPSPAYDNQSVTITFNAAEGNQGLKDYSGDIYAHTGVITDKSTSDSDWKYVKSPWGVNIAACKLTSIGNNKYTLQLSPSIREYYGVPADEKIEKMAFVFRAHDNSKEGKTSSNGDIFVSVSTVSLTVSINKPVESSVYAPASIIPVEVTATNATGITIFVNDVQVGSAAENTLSTNLTAGNPGVYTLKVQATDGTNTKTKELTFYVREEVVTETMPAGLRRGVNKTGNNSVTIVLFAPYKEYVHLIGSFNDWKPTNEYQMKKDGDYFWLTLNDLNADIEYAFQFYIDGEIRVADPYTNKTLDQDDHWISSEVYPNLMEYPTGLTNYVASVFKINEETYNWSATDITTPDVTKLVVYELHIRDFSDAGDIKTVTDSIEYLKTLGVTAIELMPINEFEGNNSWGYNPSFYFATDKAYGTSNDYKEFIDVCHQNGMVVLIDMVLNHSFGQSPFARMYLDGGKPAANNPWYNRESNIENSGLSWGYDFNHESIHTQELVDSICSYWMSEYKVDGFRFDFTKGFSNTPFTVADDEWANGPDASRVTILERMADEIWKRKSNAIVAFEHLADNSEEKELAEHGILLWGNHNHNFNETTMGYHQNSDFSWASYKKRGWTKPHIINYMESHDEERIMYKNEQYGASLGSYNVKDVATGLKRTEAAAVFLMSIPGPKMIWQFGELGYDYSINTCADGTVNGCRTEPKPIKWEYWEDANRKSLFETYSTIIDLKKEEPVFATEDFVLDVASAVKRIELNYLGSDIRLIGNFDLVEKTVKPNFSSTGYWFNHFKGDSVEVNDTEMTLTLDPGEFALLSQKKLKGFVPHTGIGNPHYFKNAWIAPNPAKEFVTVYSGDKPMENLKLTTITGDTVFEEVYTGNEVKVDLQNLPTGVYLLHITGKNNGYKIFKLLVN